MFKVRHIALDKYIPNHTTYQKSSNDIFLNVKKVKDTTFQRSESKFPQKELKSNLSQSIAKQ